VPLLVEGEDLHVRVLGNGLEGQRIACAGPDWKLENLTLPLLGSYQPTNALLAVAAARQLQVPEEAVREGLERVRWPGRFQIVARDPWVVLDGAHNPGGARALAGSLAEFFPGLPVTLVIGVSRDKDVAGILGALAPVARRVILTRSADARAAAPEALVPLVPSSVAVVEVASSPPEAMARARAAPGDPVVCVAGSLYLIGDVLKMLAGTGDEPCEVERP
jgi:dihydrofolate synthase/folylpolyglutamate synthase